MSQLIETLQHMQKRPGMYFGDPAKSHSIHVVQAFVLGFQTGQQAADKSNDFDCFREWVAAHYRVLADTRGVFDLILEQAGGDEKKAFDDFFRILPDYVRDRDELGWNGIQTRFGEVQDELRKESGGSRENQ